MNWLKKKDKKLIPEYTYPEAKNKIRVINYEMENLNALYFKLIE